MTVKEILDAVGADTKLKNELLTGLKGDIQGAAQTLGLIIRTPEEDKTFVENQISSQVDSKFEERFGKKFKDKMDEIDAQVEAITGVKKKPHSTTESNEKTLDYIKRAMSEYAEKNKTSTGERVAALEKLLAEAEEGYKAKEKKFKEDMFALKVDTSLETDLNKRSILIPATLKTDKEKQEYEKRTREMIRLAAKAAVKVKEDDKGQLLLHKGEELLQHKQNGKLFGWGDVLDQEYGTYFVPEGVNQPGSGRSPEGGATFTSTEAIHKQLASEGLIAGNPDYLEKFNNLVKEHKVQIGAPAKEPAEA